jgi:hypothetical protein
MKLAPLILFTFNRPKHTAQTLKALAANEFSSNTNLYIYLDGPRSKEDYIKIKEVREVIQTTKTQNIFKSIKVIESKENKGLANSIISGVSLVFLEYNSVIVLEDDLISSNDFLQYMNTSLNKYENNNKIASISGYNPLKKIPNNYKYDAYFSTRTSSHGWATWKSNWSNVDWKAKAYNRFKKSFRLRTAFNSTGYDRANRLDRQINRDAKSWSIIFGFDLFIKNKYTLYPVNSKIINIGWDGSGTHTSDVSVKFNDILKVSKYPLLLPSEIVLDKKIIKMKRKLFGDSFLMRIKDILTFIKHF